MDQLIAMKVFVAVVDESSFSSAAEKLNLSRTMVSKHVMDLESHLDARLLNRTTRRQSLTGTGRAYYERANRILSEIAEADAEAMRQSLTPSGRLCVNAPVAFGVAHMAPNLGRYLERYPEVEVDLTLNDRVVDLVDEGYDMAIRIGWLEDSSLIARRIADSRMVACAAPDYLARRGVPSEPSDLANHQCLVYSYATAPDRWTFKSGTARY
jgi:DNA-binding transcriptional LysR family regulator